MYGKHISHKRQRVKDFHLITNKKKTNRKCKSWARAIRIYIVIGSDDNWTSHIVLLLLLRQIIGWFLDIKSTRRGVHFMSVTTTFITVHTPYLAGDRLTGQIPIHLTKRRVIYNKSDCQFKLNKFNTIVCIFMFCFWLRNLTVTCKASLLVMTVWFIGTDVKDNISLLLLLV